MHHLRAQFGHAAVGQAQGADPAPDLGARLQNNNREPDAAQGPAAGEAGYPSPDDEDVDRLQTTTSTGAVAGVVPPRAWML